MNRSPRTLLGLLILGAAGYAALPGTLAAQETQVPSGSPTRAEMEYRAVQRTRPAYQEPPAAMRRADGDWGTAPVFRQPAAPGRAVRASYQEAITPPPPSTAPNLPNTPMPSTVASPDDLPLGPVPTGQAFQPGMTPGAPMGEGCDHCAGGSCCPQGGDTWGDSCCGCCGCCDLLGCLGNLLYVPFVSLESGAHGFKGPLDEGLNGNFGVQEGVNFGGPLGHLLSNCMPCDINYQLGMLATQSDFSGNNVQNTNNNSNFLFRSIGRDQVFATVGVFRRAMCGGLQWDVVLDYLHDSRAADIDIKQVRAELSYACPGMGDIGFWGTFGGDTQAATFGRIQPTIQALNIYALFYRYYFPGGGEWRMWGGLTDRSDGVLGSDIRVPIAQSLALEHSILGMIPSRGSTLNGVNLDPRSEQRETWSIMFNLVWYPGQASHCIEQNPYRPLLNTASNSSMIVDVR